MVLKSIKDERGRDSGGAANLPSNVVPRLHHNIHLGHHLGHPPQHVAGGAPELARPADDRELRLVVVDPDAAGDDEGAAAARPVGERDGDGGHEDLLVLGGQHVGALRPADGAGVDAGAIGDEVVDGHRVAEVRALQGLVRRPGVPDEVDGRLLRAADDVVHV
uniref:Uncharacterized protein n=1 Tax=Setaria italica TaxID=4555 RepID=K3XZN5_SETIT